MDTYERLKCAVTNELNLREVIEVAVQEKSQLFYQTVK